jgi:hypothetical protein
MRSLFFIVVSMLLWSQVGQGLAKDSPLDRVHA